MTAGTVIRKISEKRLELLGELFGYDSIRDNINFTDHSMKLHVKCAPFKTIKNEIKR
jgi:hypothetical protein